MQVYLFTFLRVYLRNYGGNVVSFIFCCRAKKEKKRTLHFYLCFLLKEKKKKIISLNQLNILFRKLAGISLRNIDFSFEK